MTSTLPQLDALIPQLRAASGHRESAGAVPTISSIRLSKRQRQVWDLLADGPTSSSHLAGRLGVTRGAVLHWLRVLEQRGMARTTQPGRRSRNQMWERTAAEPFTDA